MNKHQHIEIFDDFCYKKPRSKKHLTSYWLDCYNELSDKNPSLVKIYELDELRNFKMEKIDIIKTLEQVLKIDSNHHYLNKILISDIIVCLNTIWIDCINFSRTLSNNKFFIHDDLMLHNIVLTEDYQIKIIDPESFRIVDNLDHCEKYYMSQINLMYNVQKYFLTQECK